MAETIRVGAIGVGSNVFNMHRAGLELDEVQLVAAVDINADAARACGAEFGCPWYTDYQDMLREADLDVVAVLTPHPFHAEQSIASLEAGFHVLVEKPMAIQVAEADAMIAAAQRTGKTLAVNFQQRTRPEVIAAYEIIQSGKLGEIQNADMKMTWTRPSIYFAQSTWRGTWNGEGAGVLLNQAPHELDLLCYFLGMPIRVMGWTRNLVHDIETEDTIQAMVEWANGAVGSIHISTAEAGQDQRFEIIGTGGHLALGKGSLTLKLFDTELREFIATSPHPFSAPNLEAVPVELTAGAGNHAAIYRDLLGALATGTDPVAPPESSRQGLELANAINYSSYRNAAVEFPLDRAAYSALLAELQASVK